MLTANFKRDVALLSETRLKPHVRSNIAHYDVYRTDHEDRATLASTVEAAGVCIPTGNTEMQRLRSGTEKQVYAGR
jgi:hypothetical protein